MNPKQKPGQHLGMINDAGMNVGDGWDAQLNGRNVIVVPGGNTKKGREPQGILAPIKAASGASITINGERRFPMKRGDDIIYTLPNRTPSPDARPEGNLQGGGLDNYDWHANARPAATYQLTSTEEPEKTKINTTQSGNTPIVTRSHNEEYVQKKAQWGDNPAVRDAADRGFAVGQAYLAGDPLDDTPDYIRPGSEEYMQRADMQVWAEANPEAAAALAAKGKRRDARAGRARSGGGSATFSEDPTDNWKKLTGAEKIYDFQTTEDQKTRGATTEWKSSRMGNMIGAVQEGIMKTRAGVDPRAAEGQGAAIAVEESAITDIMDQNPGAGREDAKAMLQAGRAAKPGVIARTGATGNQMPDYVVDGMMERHGQKRNQAIDMVRSEEPGAFLEMGKRHMEPGQNRANTFGGSAQRAHARQAAFTGTQENGPSMQMPSGLTGFAPQKAPLRNEQGNIYMRADGDLQENDDHISPERFAYEASQHVGREMFGPEYSPSRAMPQF